MDPEQILKKTSLFAGLEDVHYQRLGSIAQPVDVPRGKLIFSEGDEAAGFYIPVEGRVRVFKLSPSGKEQMLHVFGPGEPVGEAAVFAGGPFPANAAAMEAARLLFFPRDAFTEAVRADPAIALRMVSVLSRRLMGFARLIEDLSLKEAPARLAAYLLLLREQSGGGDEVELPMSKSQLSNLLGTTPETLSRMLGKLTQEGALAQVDSRRLRLLDPAFLKRIDAGEERLS
jgi:CRP/FNR family transcriptional regulator